MEERKALVKYTNMDNRMVEFAISTAVQALDRYEVSKEIADYIKRTFDKKYDRTWHCVVGRDFGSSVTHTENSLIHFTLDKRTFMLFKWG
ncbi:Dynein light chain cytoplasmic [Fasciola gigantica]|uniref:Dynein light chain n=1 Tax=Fasciola gigantica TaxID=46835 RepID=A0A504YL76_FASGI|nr:Dynein light chain cytoplasmic [Fasciola gigantica]